MTRVFGSRLQPGAFFFLQHKAQNKKRAAGSAVETATAVEIDKGSLRRLLLDDFHELFGKASAKTAPALPPLPQRRRLLSFSEATTNKPPNTKFKLLPLSHGLDCTNRRFVYVGQTTFSHGVVPPLCGRPFPFEVSSCQSRSILRKSALSILGGGSQGHETFSPVACCNGRYARGYCVALGRPPRRTVEYACGGLGRAPCLRDVSAVSRRQPVRNAG
jgi:hypothetical protein